MARVSRRLRKCLLAILPMKSIGGEILFEGQNILELAPEERAHLGHFHELPISRRNLRALPIFNFCMRPIMRSRKLWRSAPLSEEEFATLLDEKMALDRCAKTNLKTRNLNEGFSGGEKKRNEILQMAVLRTETRYSDETDSGLDIDAMRIVARGVNYLMGPDNALILITHYQRLLDYIRPHFLHVVIDGKIVQTGGPELALELESRGYEEMALS